MTIPLHLRSLFFLLGWMGFSSALATDFRLGIDELERQQFSILEGKRVGLVAHPASVNSDMKATVEVLRQSDKVRLVAIFGPEHGVYGDEYAGISVNNRTDDSTGLPVHSLYGKTRKPTPEMLKELDVLIFDLQDIGSRSYTYISTMKNCLEACVDANIGFMVLDRPNPLGGERVEGPSTVEKDFESFVSVFPIPYVHGMTMGELAQYWRDQYSPHYDKLTVVKMANWKRNMTWKDTGLAWIPTSPHIPHSSTCFSYAATGILGELGQVSVGVGYPLPFNLAGAPGVKADILAETLNQHWLNPREAYRKLIEKEKVGGETSSPSGIQFRAARFKPFYSAFKETPCEGVQIFIDPQSAECLVEINFRILSALDAPKIFKQTGKEQTAMFDKVCGSDEPRKWLIDQRDFQVLFDKWKAGCKKFREQREKYLLY